MRINPRQIEAFRLVYQTGSMTTAAQMLSVTQPAVSRLIRDLEASLHLTLFTRTGAGIAATADAVVFYSEVEKSFVGLERLESAALAIRQKHEGFLHVAATGAFATRCLPQAMAQVARRYPDLKMRITATRSAEIVEMVATRRCHMGITALPGDVAGIDCEPLAEVPLRVILPRAHPLAAKETISPRDLAGEPLFGPAGNTRLHQRIARSFAREGLPYELTGDSTLGAVIAQCVAAGLGLAVLDALAGCGLEGEEITTRPFSTDLTWDPKILYPAGSSRSRPLLALAKAIHARLAELGFGSGETAT